MKQHKKFVVMFFSILLAACQTGEYGSSQTRSSNVDEISQIDLYGRSEQEEVEKKRNSMFVKNSQPLGQMFNIPQGEVDSIELYVLEAFIADFNPNIEKLKSVISLDGRIKGYDRKTESGHYIVPKLRLSEILKFVNNIKVSNNEIVISESNHFFQSRILIEIKYKNGREIHLVTEPYYDTKRNYLIGRLEGLSPMGIPVFVSAKDVTELFHLVDNSRLIFWQSSVGIRK